MSCSRISITGFQFEPEKSSEQLKDFMEPYFADDEELEGISTTRMRSSENIKEWCKCGRCKPMPMDKECVCCTEIEAIKYFHLEDKECIILHVDFRSVVLLKNCLWTALVALHDRESRGLAHRDAVSNRSYRYAAYRQFCCFIHSKLGKGVRRVLPAYVVSRIREEYPSDDGTYTGYKERDGEEDSSEIDFAWVADVDT